MKVDIFQKKIYNSLEFGPVAQLGECYIRIVEVVGSTPIGSTRKRQVERLVFFYEMLDLKQKIQLIF